MKKKQNDSKKLNKGFRIGAGTINKAGGTPKELTYAEMIRKAAEDQSKYDALKKRKEVIVDKILEAAEQGSLPHAKEIFERVDGKVPQDSNVKLSGAVSLVNAIMEIDE